MSTLLKPINSIVICDEDNIIGHGLYMPWHMTDDFLLNFKPKTLGCPMIIGSNTAKSFGKALPGRTCIALTTKDETSKELTQKGFMVTDDFFYALHIAQKASGEKIWIGGGGEIYKIARENCIVKEIHITKIEAKYPGENEVRFCGYPLDQYYIDLSRRMEFKKRTPGTNGEKDKGNSDNATVEVYVREY